MDKLFSLFKQIETPAAPPTPVEYLVVGLGNPGDKYRYTRHNIGFLAVAYIAEKCGFSVTRSRFDALSGETTIRGHRALFLLPQTFMNNSGLAVRQAADYYHIPPERIIVISDDISLAVAKLRVRTKGSAGGHNGLKSIIEHLNSDEFARVKIGVGAKPHPDMDLADHVLSVFSDEEQKALFARFDDVLGAIGELLEGNAEKAMNLYNG